MEGAAATWKQAVLRDEGPNALGTFDAFKEAFLKRFKKLKTPAESVQLVAQLRQTSAETCLDFYDRCTNSIHEAHEEDLKGLLNQPEARAGYQQAIKLTSDSILSRASTAISRPKSALSYKALTPRRSSSLQRQRSKPQSAPGTPPPPWQPSEAKSARTRPPSAR